MNEGEGEDLEFEDKSRGVSGNFINNIIGIEGEEEKIEERGTNQFFSLANDNLLRDILEEPTESEKPQMLIEGRCNEGDHSDEENDRRQSLEDIFMDAVDEIQKASVRLNETLRAFQTS